MLSYALSRNCKRDICRPYWPVFLKRLTDEQQNRKMTMQIEEEGQDNLEILKQTLFRSIACESLAEDDYLIITVAKKRGRLSTTYNYVVENPKKIEVSYEQNNQISEVAITDAVNIRTIIQFENDAARIYRKSQILLSPLIGTAPLAEGVWLSHYRMASVECVDSSKLIHSK